MNTGAPGEEGSGYFLYHSIGMFPGKATRVAEAVASLARIWGTPDDAQWDASLAIRAHFLEHWCRLINVPRSTITTAENVTTALYSLVGALPERLLAGKRVLIAADCFPSLHFLLSGMAARRGFTLHTVQPRPGESWVRDEDFIQQWGPDVALALLTYVTSTTSHRCNLSALVTHGRAMGSLVGVDITQGIGIVPFDASAPQVDFVVSTTLKWLCGVAGAGVLHVRDGLLRQCAPELRGWFSQENIFSWNLEAFAYASDARRFDHGTPSIFACAACIPALQWHERQDPADLRAHNQRLVTSILDATPSLGLIPASPLAAEERGGSLMLKLPQGVKGEDVISALRLERVYADCRGTTLRLSPGNMTTMEGVERLLRVLRRVLGRA
jgi:kynureninase